MESGLKQFCKETRRIEGIQYREKNRSGGEKNRRIQCQKFPQEVEVLIGYFSTPCFFLSACENNCKMSTVTQEELSEV